MEVERLSRRVSGAYSGLVVEPITSRQDRERFIRLPWEIYADEPAWVPPLLIERRRLLDPRRNPFFHHAEAQLFLVRRGPHLLGRIAAFVNHSYNRLRDDLVGFFGFFEVLPDQEAAAALIATAEDWLIARKVRLVQGPVNFSLDNDVGLLLDAYDQSPVLMTTYNPSRYRTYIESAGYSKALDWYAYTISRADLGGEQPTLPPILLRAVNKAQNHAEVSFRTVQMQHFNAELARVQTIYNRAWEQNAGFVPLDDAEVRFMADDLRQIVDPGLVFFAEVGSEPVGVSITLPDLNQVLRTMNGRLLPTGWWKLLRGRRRITTVRFFAMGMVPEYRHRGLDTVFYALTLKAAIERGYERAELSLINEINMPMRHTLDLAGARCAKTYRVYEKVMR